jgi:hypothetical protein
MKTFGSLLRSDFIRRAGRGGPMVLRRVLLFSSLATTFAVFGSSGPTAAANPAQGPIFGIAKGTTEVNLDTGAGTTVNQGFLLGIGLFKGNSSSTFAYTGPNTFSSTGSGTLVTANGNELFITSVGTGTLSGTAVNATTVDTITGGTGRFEGASGHITIYARGTSASTLGSNETFTTLGLWVGTISYPVVSLSDLAGSPAGTLSAVAQGNGCSFLEATFTATYPGNRAVGTVTLQMDGCVPLVLPPNPEPFTGTFTLITSVGTVGGSVTGQLTNVNTSGGVYPSTAAFALTTTSATGEFAGITGTLNLSLQWAQPSSLSFTGTLTPA